MRTTSYLRPGTVAGIGVKALSNHRHGFVKRLIEGSCGRRGTGPGQLTIYTDCNLSAGSKTVSPASSGSHAEEEPQYARVSSDNFYSEATNNA